MHRALTQLDICHEIVRHLSISPIPVRLQVSTNRRHQFWKKNDSNRLDGCSENHGETTALKALRCLALTCKAFCDLALDELWAAPPGGLYTVLSLLSNFTCVYNQRTNRVRSFGYYVGASFKM